MQPYEILADLGNCREVDPNTMYPPEGDVRLEAIAKSVCDGCVVIELCKETAGNRESGVWAGMTEVERTRQRRNVRREQSRRGHPK